MCFIYMSRSTSHQYHWEKKTAMQRYKYDKISGNILTHLNRPTNQAKRTSTIAVP